MSLNDEAKMMLLVALSDGDLDDLDDAIEIDNELDCINCCHVYFSKIAPMHCITPSMYYKNMEDVYMAEVKQSGEIVGKVGKCETCGKIYFSIPYEEEDDE